jgi:hypothetical protein
MEDVMNEPHGVSAMRAQHGGLVAKCGLRLKRDFVLSPHQPVL